MPARLRRRVDTLQAFTVPALTPGPTVDAAVLTILAQACRDEERVQFRYAPPGRRPHQRTAEPLRLVSHGRRWFGCQQRVVDGSENHS